jgi:hypothetical protein
LDYEFPANTIRKGNDEILLGVFRNFDTYVLALGLFSFFF